MVKRLWLLFSFVSLFNVVECILYDAGVSFTGKGPVTGGGQ